MLHLLPFYFVALLRLHFFTPFNIFLILFFFQISQLVTNLLHCVTLCVVLLQLLLIIYRRISLKLYRLLVGFATTTCSGLRWGSDLCPPKFDPKMKQSMVMPHHFGVGEWLRTAAVGFILDLSMWLLRPAAAFLLSQFFCIKYWLWNCISICPIF